MINIRKSPPIIHDPVLLMPVSSSRPTALAARIRNNVGNANNIIGVPNTQTQLINLEYSRITSPAHHMYQYHNKNANRIQKHIYPRFENLHPFYAW